MNILKILNKELREGNKKAIELSHLIELLCFVYGCHFEEILETPQTTQKIKMKGDRV